MMSKEESIRAALIAAFTPVFLKIEDESQFHHRGEQTHYKVVIVSDEFVGLMPVKRHQKIYGALGDLMQQFHALALHTYTVSEWQQRESDNVASSPVCQGGSLHDLQNK